MTVQTAVLIETLVDLGADVRWASCNIFSTGPGCRSLAAAGVPVFAKKGETLAEYWEYVDRIFDWSDGGTANMILDDGGDATVHPARRPCRGRKDVLASPSSEEEEFLKAQIERRAWRAGSHATPKGVSEETTTGVLRLYQLAEAGGLPFPAINVVTP